jgi:hypothetical protein
MKSSIYKMMIAATLTAIVGVQAEASAQSKSIVVEFPSDLPELAQRNSEAMYLHHTGAGQAVLYLEQDQGRTLAILDVTDPAHVRPVGQVSIGASSPYDFVQSLNGSAALIHFRNRTGFAVMSFKKYKEPVVRNEPEYLHPASEELAGSDGLLLVSSGSSSAPARGSQYEVISISDPPNSTPLATVQGVIQRLDRPQTGTIFLLNDHGLTIVRSLAAEQEHKIEVQQKNEN